MGSNFTEYNEMPAPNVYEAKAASAKHSDTLSRSLQNAPEGFTTDNRGNSAKNMAVTVTQGHQSGQPGDVLKSARSQHGSPVEVITDDTVVSINGVTATARSAARAGLLTKNPDGSYAEKAPQKAQAQPMNRVGIDPLSRDSRSYVRALENRIGKQNTENFMHRFCVGLWPGERAGRCQEGVSGPRGH